MFTYDEQSFIAVGLEEDSTLDLKLGEIFRIRSDALIKNIIVYKKVNYKSILQLFGDINIALKLFNIWQTQTIQV